MNVGRLAVMQAVMRMIKSHASGHKLILDQEGKVSSHTQHCIVGCLHLRGFSSSEASDVGGYQRQDTELKLQ